MRRLVGLVALFTTLGCSSEALVSIDLHTDLAPVEEFDEIVVAIDGIEVDSSGVGADEYVVRGRRLGPFTVTPGVHQLAVSLESRGARVLARGQRVSVTGSVVVPVWIMRTCVEVSCPTAAAPAATECQDGRCVEPTCVASDPCATACVSVADCDPAAARCAQVRCVESHCVAVALAGECTDLEYCDPDLGCVVRSVPLDGGTADAGPAEPTDAGPPDSAPPDAGPPPVDAPATGGCATDADCAPTTYGTWGGCGGYASTCDEGGTRSRGVTSYRCVMSVCGPEASTDTGACSRSTTGLSCGSTTTSVVAACSYASTCDTSATETVRTTSYACGGGTCRTSSSDSPRACSRTTSGMLCGGSTMCPFRCVVGTCEPQCRVGCPC